jgi:hypothetical protein
MKKKSLIMLLFMFSLSMQAQNNQQTNGFVPPDYQGLPSEIYWKVVDAFISDWSYFRMQKNPLLTFEETHDKWGDWKNPFLIPDTFFRKHYPPVIKITPWFPDAQADDERDKGSIIDNMYGCYVVEKGDGITGIKRDLWTQRPLDTLHLNIYDSIFPYDNRFLICKTLNGGYRSFSGNATWGTWYYDLFWYKDVASLGHIRGVQFEVKRVNHINKPQQDEIRQIRSEYPDYEYALANSSLLSCGRLLIAAPKGKEDKLIEYIYYTNDSRKTKDKDKKNFYEFRYILPTEIKSVKERRQEVRKLSQEEYMMIDKSYLSKFIESNWEDLYEENVVDE